jgi:glycosidase
LCGRNRGNLLVSFAVPPKIISALLCLLLAVRAAAQTAPNTFWQAQSIYQIFTDRFFDGDSANNNAAGSYNAASGTSVHGGDFRGIEQKLDYIKAMGFTAIWISPVVKNGSGEYHGYSGADFYSVDPHWGTLSNLQVMINAAHAKGMLVIQDVVINHGSTLNNINGNTAFTTNGYNLSYANASKKYAAPFNTNSVNPSLTNLFHNFGAITDYNSTQQLELGELSGLDDFRTESAYVRTNMAAVYAYWITNAGFDGFRVDTVKHAEMGFWQDWCPRIHAAANAAGKTNFFMFGEVFDGSESKVGSYSGTNGGGAFKLDALLDYPLFFAAQNVFEFGNNTKLIEDHYNALPSNYDTNTQNQLVTFLDNHDTTRFLNSANANGDTNRLAVALNFLLTSRGIPCVYQGTEQAFNGGTDPNNREDMFAGQFKDAGFAGADSFNLTQPIFLQIAKLNNFRRLYPALSLGTHVNQWNNPSAAGLFAYSRRFGTQEVFVVFNTASSTQTLPARSTTFAANAALVNLLDTNEIIFVTAASLTPTISVPPLTAKMFLAQSQLLPLDPVVVTNFPAHSATNIAPSSSVVLRFSQPMNTNSVQAAFSTAPSVSGTFSWSAARDTVTFTPAVGGFTATTNITVTVSNSAFASASGKTLFAAYSLMFRTAAAPPVVQFSSPATDGTVVSNNVTYLVQVCFTPTLTTNTASLFQLSVNGILQPSANYILRPVGAVAGCPGFRSLLYNWPVTTPGTNFLQVIFSNGVTVLTDARTVIVAPPLVITGLTGSAPQIVWSSTPGVNYLVLATTNLAWPFAPVSGTISASGLTTAFTDISNTPPAAQKFYLIETVP